MDFATLPPEVNSANMYAGPGASPLLSAASAWDQLAAELSSTAASYEAVIAELDSGWAGPSAAAMAAAATPYVDWMHTTAGQAEQTATQAKAAATAYESAFTKMVPPPAIAANRSQLTSLIQANLLGQNTAAIAATEAAYMEMWAQDATVMYGYAGEAVGATRLAPFAPPPDTTNPAGSANQSAAVGQAAATAAGTQAQTAVSSLAAAPAAVQAVDPTLGVAYTGLAASLFGAFVIDSAGSFGIDSAGSFGIDLIGVDLAEVFGAPHFVGAIPGGLSAGGAVPAAPVAAAVGQSSPVGGLSVPQAWTVKAPPVIQHVSTSTALAASGADAVPEVDTGESGISFAEMATAGVAARALTAAGRGRGRGKSTARQRSGAPQGPSGGLITRIAPELRELAELRDAGILTDEEFAEQKRLLLGR
jgi:PPE-repeat protein